MSEIKNEAVEETKRKPFVVEVDPIKFEADEEGKYMTSNELCGLASGIFREIFDDFYGTKFELMNNRFPSISLHFSHVDKTEGGTVATERLSAKQVGNTTIDKTRSRDNMMIHGDRYTLTDDGKDFIKKLLMPKLFNNGKPNWGNILAPVADNTAQSIYAPANVQQLTKVAFIDPKRICALLWGEKDESGLLDYDVAIIKDLTMNYMGGMPGNPNSNYVLRITKAHTDTIMKTYEKFGIGTFGSSIIR